MAHSRILESIGQALHVRHDDIVKEPLPERWIDLINYLNEKERAPREPKTVPPPKRSYSR
jgi:hypothetical protein